MICPRAELGTPSRPAIPINNQRPVTPKFMSDSVTQA
jgi:hypothetical protein